MPVTAKNVHHDVPWTPQRGKGKRRRFSILLAALALVTTAACSDNPSAPVLPDPDPVPSANDPVAGNFTLNTVNNASLPFVMFNDGGFSLEIASSTVEMQQGGQFVMVLTTREVVVDFASFFVDTMRGTWTQNVGNVVLNGDDGNSASAVWNGTQLAFPMEGESGVLQLVYAKDP